MEAGGVKMSVQKRLDDLAKEIATIEQEIAELTAQHAERVQVGDDSKADYLHEQILGARERLEAAQMRRAPLERALQAELDAARAKEAAKLTADADARLDALEATLAQALDAAKALAEITDGLDQNAALSWSIVARRAVDAGGTPNKRHLAGLAELAELTHRATRKLQHIGQDYSQRSVRIPVPTRSRAA